MKKFVTKPRIILAVLVVTFVALRYYIKPEWFDRDHVYYKVYNYQIHDIKPEKKIIKDITVDFVNGGYHQLPEGGEVTEDIMSREVLQKISQLHVTFTDNSKADIENVRYNNRFDFGNSTSDKLEFRFPGANYNGVYKSLEQDSVLLLYPGDTLFQVPNDLKEISYQVKNPKTGKMQTYYEYGSPMFSLTPRYLVLNSETSSEERQTFFDDYNKKSVYNYLNPIQDISYNNHVTETFSTTDSSKIQFYSRKFENLPLAVSSTGSQFKITVRNIIVGDQASDDQYHVKISSKTYDEDNKEDYISEVLERQNWFILKYWR